MKKVVMAVLAAGIMTSGAFADCVNERAQMDFNFKIIHEYKQAVAIGAEIYK